MARDPRVNRFLDAWAAEKPGGVRASSIAQRRAGLTELPNLSGVAHAGTRVENRTLVLPRCVLAALVASTVDAGETSLRAAKLDRHPRTIAHSPEYAPLRDEERMYFDRLTGTGRGLSYTCHPGMIHLIYGLGDLIPYARTAIEQIGDEMRAAWTGIVT